VFFWYDGDDMLKEVESEQKAHYSDIAFSVYALFHISKYAGIKWVWSSILQVIEVSSFIMGKDDSDRFVLGEDCFTDFRFAIVFGELGLLEEMMGSGAIEKCPEKFPYSCLNFVAMQGKDRILEMLLDYWLLIGNQTRTTSILDNRHREAILGSAFYLSIYHLRSSTVKILLSRYPELANWKLCYQHAWHIKTPSNITGLELIEAISKIQKSMLMKELRHYPERWNFQHNVWEAEDREGIMILLKLKS